METGYPEGFLTIPDVEDQLFAARNATGALVISYMPRVQTTDYNLWTRYAEENKGWIAESNDAVGEEAEITPFIWEYYETDEDQGAMNNGHRSLESCSARRRRTSEEVKAPSNRLNGPFSPVWTMSPPPAVDDAGIINYNLVDRPVFERAVGFIEQTRLPVFLDVCDQSAWFAVSGNEDILQTVVAFPVFSDFEPDSDVVGAFTAIVPWTRFFDDNLVDGTEPILLVVSNTCNEVFSFAVNGREATFLAEEDLHDPRYDQLFVEGPFADSYNPSENIDNDHCVYTMKVYPTASFEAYYKTYQPIYYSLAVLMIFLVTSLFFVIFDCLVQRRQSELVNTARQQNAIVSSLFPKSIQAKLMKESATEKQRTNAFLEKKKVRKANLRTFLNGDAENNQEDEAAESDPIADLFPETTVMFADIAGFTAWSSAREPSQVFTLLEGVYHEFDKIAKRRHVFKVEVVGDCYVAVCGLPDPRPDHALVMAKFATDCMNKMKNVVHKLEVKLGPDTADLKLRVGMHSGPVVAGSTGIANSIQLSQETADLLKNAGKEHWLISRKDRVEAKGKGELQTFFLETSKMARPYQSSLGSTTHSASEIPVSPDEIEKKKMRSAEWTVEIMAHHLKAMAQARKARRTKPADVAKIQELEQSSCTVCEAGGQTVVDEIAETIIFPDNNVNGNLTSNDSGDTVLDPVVLEELRSFVLTVASLYNENPFHNFDHATHVAMSVNKLLRRINAPDLDDDLNEGDVHDHTYGVGNDPLTWFACVFSALIHDVDHCGVPNAQLVKEDAPVAELYSGKAVAEQNSLDMSWELLMEPSYLNLRKAIYVNEPEFHRFRQLVVNGVMATDIVDKDLKTLRNKRWETAFDPTLEGSRHEMQFSKSTVNRKATIVIEHLIQASDVAHTMQHWAIYRKWNERFFKECYEAYVHGRAETNPIDSWYKGELGFFDFYIIPLAKKLKECGVFGVSSDEYLLYAQQNRMEWEERGKKIVEEMAAK
ncbi:MAG: hypothetical protein SGILL_006104, partial [Bacillariaceae sp.]